MEQRIEGVNAKLRVAQRGLDEAMAAQAQSQDREQRRQADLEDEVRRLKQRCEQLVAERDSAQRASVHIPPSELKSGYSDLNYRRLPAQQKSCERKCRIC